MTAMQAFDLSFKGFLLLSVVAPCVRSFHLVFSPAATFRTGASPTTTVRRLPSLLGATTSNGNENSGQKWLNHGLLFSSFGDGLSQNTQAKTFLKQGLAKALLLDQCTTTENKIKSSVMASPCNGPDVSFLEDLQNIDTALEHIQDARSDPMSLLGTSSSTTTPLELRFVYIPTAVYALRSESTNTPGKQRQRARADGKKRRDRVVEFLQNEIVPEGALVRAITLDFDDGSVKQPEGGSHNYSGGARPFPSNGKQALMDWKPHLIYVEGGNTFWLAHCVEKGDWGELLTQLITGPHTVYCGSSAGAILVGQRVETACWKGWDDPRVVAGREYPEDWEGVPGLGLVGDASFFPHMDECWNDLVESKKQTLTRVECLNESDVLCVRGPEQSRWLAAGTPVEQMDEKQGV